MYKTDFFFHKDLQKALPSMVFMLGVISFTGFAGFALASAVAGLHDQVC